MCHERVMVLKGKMADYPPRESSVRVPEGTAFTSAECLHIEEKVREWMILIDTPEADTA